MTSSTLTRQTVASSPLTSSAVVFHARTFPPQIAEAMASMVIAAASGTACSTLSQRCTRDGSWSRTSLMPLGDGLIPFVGGWHDGDMKAYRSRLRRAFLALPIVAPESSLLPTLSAQAYGSNRGGGAGRVGKVRHSLQSLARMQGGRLCLRWLTRLMGLPESWCEL
jgi:hypothetical protein